MSGNDDREPVAPAMDSTDVFSDEEIEALITWCDDHLGSAEVAPILASAIVDNVMPGNTWELYDVQARVYPPIEGSWSSRWRRSARSWSRPVLEEEIRDREAVENAIDDLEAADE